MKKNKIRVKFSFKCMNSMFLSYSLLNMKLIWLYYLVLINLYNFMSGYLYFPNNLQDIKDLT